MNPATFAARWPLRGRLGLGRARLGTSDRCTGCGGLIGVLTGLDLRVLDDDGRAMGLMKDKTPGGAGANYCQCAYDCELPFHLCDFPGVGRCGRCGLVFGFAIVGAVGYFLIVIQTVCLLPSDIVAVRSQVPWLNPLAGLVFRLNCQ